MSNAQIRPLETFLSPPHMSGEELKGVIGVFDENYIAPAGRQIVQFEEDFKAYTGFPHAVALTSGTSATDLALRALSLRPEDEVWGATLTFIASIGPVHHLGAQLRFFDCDEGSWTLDADLLREELLRASRTGRLPKAVVPTDLYGQSCDLDAIVDACREYGVPVICDSAEAMGAWYKGRHAGRGASAAIFSFNGNKIITTSNGGMLASDDEKMIKTARYLATQAREDVPHYEHKAVGFNYRLSNVLAAIGVGQLGVLNDRVTARRSIFERYRKNLGGIPGIAFMPEADNRVHTRWLTTLTIDPATGVRPAAVLAALRNASIEGRPLWKPMHMQPVFKGAAVAGGSVAERLYDLGVCLPSGSQMTDQDVDRVSGVVAECFGA